MLANKEHEALEEPDTGVIDPLMENSADLRDAGRSLRALERPPQLGRHVNSTVSAAISVPELLEMIFMAGLALCITPRAFNELYDSGSYLLAISHTCRRWRGVALSVPPLWTHVHIEWHQHQRSFWLSRMKTRNIDIVGHRLYNWKGFDSNSDVFLHVPRWRSIQLLKCDREAIQHVLRCIKHGIQYPSLTSVDIRCPMGRRYMSSEWPWSGRESPESSPHFPALRHVTWWSTPQSFRMLSNIISLDIDRATFHTWATWRSVLTEARHLEYLRVSNQAALSESYVATRDLPPLDMPHLHTVDFGLPNHHSFISRWLQDVDSPSVCTFALFIEIPAFGEKRQVGEKISSFLSTYLSRSSSIVNLTLGGEKWFLRAAMPSLSTRGAYGFLLPELHTLEIRDKIYSPDGWHGVRLLNELREVVSRAPGGPESIPRPLNTLRIPQVEDEWLKRHVPILEVSDPMNVSPVDAFYQETDNSSASIDGGGAGIDDMDEHSRWLSRLWGLL